MALLLWAVGCFVFFQSNYQYHFYYQEQNQLFLLSPDYISQYWQTEDSWLSLLIGDYLTQFYYYRYLGSTLLSGSLLLLGMLVRKIVLLCLVRKPVLGPKKAFLTWQESLSCIAALAVMTLEAVFALDNKHRLSDLWSVILWAFVLFIGLILVRITAKRFAERPKGKAITATVAVLVSALFLLLGSSAFGSPFRGHWGKPDYVMERVLAYDNEYYFGHYNRVIEMGRADADSIRDEQSFFYYLSCAQTGSIADHMKDMENIKLGTFITIGPDTPLFDIKMINELYWLLGDMTYAERAALMALTFSPNNRNVRMVKRLAEINLVKDDIPAARKYLRMLENTMVYKQWAADHTPETMTAEVKADIERKRKMTNKMVGIRQGDNCRVILLQLLESNRENYCALDYLLCSDILVREIVTFKKDYDAYGPRMNPVYQEVLNIYEQNAPKMLNEGGQTPTQETQQELADDQIVRTDATSGATNTKQQPQ